MNSLYEWLMIVQLEGFLPGEMEFLQIEIALNFFFQIFFSFSNLHTRKIKPKYTIYEVNTISRFKTISLKNQTISIH